LGTFLDQLATAAAANAAAIAVNVAAIAVNVAAIVEAAKGYPSTKWFNLPVTKDVALAGVPGTPDASALSEYGRINIAQDGSIEAIHLHQDKDGTSLSCALEVYRRRSGVMTLIANATLSSGGGDFGFALFSFVSESLKSVERGDYLMLQATSKMGGSPVGFVDVHFERTTL